MLRDGSVFTGNDQELARFRATQDYNRTVDRLKTGPASSLFVTITAAAGGDNDAQERAFALGAPLDGPLMAGVALPGRPTLPRYSGPNTVIEGPLVPGRSALSPFTQRYLNESGGRWGNTDTRTQNYQISQEYAGNGYRITGGGGIRSEEFISGVGPGTRGGTFVDITARSSDGRVVRIQTVDTLPNGQPTPNEAAAAARIRAARPNDELRLIPKVK
jgi:hypothetical protein